MVLLQYDYKGLRLYGKTRGLTHTDALYLEYIDGVRASPSSVLQRKLCKRQIDSAPSASAGGGEVLTYHARLLEANPRSDVCARAVYSLLQRVSGPLERA